MLEYFLETFNGLAGLGLSTWQRAQVARDLTIEAVAGGQAGQATADESVIYYKAEDGSGMWSLTSMREQLRDSYDGWNTGSEDDIVRIYSQVSGKVLVRV